MATSMGRGIVCQTLKLSIKPHLLQPRISCNRCAQYRRTSSAVSKTNQEDIFIRTDVQEILRKVTGFNLSKIFHPRMTDTEVPKYVLATDSQLEQLQEDALRKGYHKLQFPPVMRPREDSEVILAEDKEIAGHSDSKVVFTDVTYGISDKSRVIVVREPCGKLRMASCEERDRQLQTFFPRPGKMYNTPKMFNEDHLERLLHQGKFEYILDRACVQFEPDDPQYIRVSQRTYEFVTSRGDFDTLRSTRHFGPLVFYLTFNRKPESLIVDMIQRDLLADAAAVVRLYHIMYPDCPSAQQAAQQGLTDPAEIIELYSRESSAHGGPVQLALQAYQDAKKMAPRAQTAG